MTAERHAAPDHSPAASPARRETSLSGFAQLAKRISVWTTRGIVSAAILVMGLAFGRQMVVWWGPEGGEEGAPPPPSLSVGALGRAAAEHVLEFGDTPWRMGRQAIAGDEKHVLSALQGRCAGIVRSSAVPGDAPGPAERDFLKKISGQKPAQEEIGKWRLYALDAAFPMVIGTRPAASTPPPGDGVAGLAWRVVTWGLAVPMGTNSWTIYTFEPADSGGDVSPVSRVPIPPQSSRILSIRAADGSAVVSFRGPDRPDACRRFFDSWLAAEGWRTVVAWRQHGTAWSVRGARTADASRESLDVFFVSDGSGEMTGLVLRTPLPNSLPKGERP